MKQYLVENSHEPIIEPEVYDLVQEKLAIRSQYRNKLRDNHPFSNKLICGDCGSFFGHKVWHNHANTERYDVWYCNQKYNQTVKCQTPVIKQNEIITAFEKVLAKIECSEQIYSDDLWHKLIDRIIVHTNLTLDFHLKDSRIVSVRLIR